LSNKTVSGIMLILLIISMLTLAFNIQHAQSSEVSILVGVASPSGQFGRVDPSTGEVTPLSNVGGEQFGFPGGVSAVDPNTHQFFLCRHRNPPSPPDNTTAATTGEDVTYHLLAINITTGEVSESPAMSQSLIALGFEGMNLIKGDLLLGMGTKWVPGFWSHVGMYIGDGQVVESHFNLGGVNITSLENWFDRYKTWAVLRVVTADKEIRDEAVVWATHPDRLDDSYDWMWWQKDANGEAWYCSELVWAAYLHASDWQINIEYGPDWTGITPDEIEKDDDTEVIAVHYGETSQKGLLIMTKCPVDLEVVDPENLSVNKQSIEVSEAIYGEDDVDGDGSPDDWIGIPERKIGNYFITVVPEIESSPTDTYSLIVEAENTIILAENTSLNDIPSQPYVIESAETIITYLPTDTAPPAISIVSPENKTYIVNNVALTFTVDELTSWIGYSLNGQANSTITGNRTLLGLPDGPHNLIVYANDTAGNTGTSEIIYFTIKTQQTEPLQLWIIAIIIMVAGVGSTILIYLARIKKAAKKTR
jgi:hypothetical protein